MWGKVELTTSLPSSSTCWLSFPRFFRCVSVCPSSLSLSLGVLSLPSTELCISKEIRLCCYRIRMWSQ